MPITRLTLTGPDDRDLIAGLNALYATHPSLEIGLLYSEGRAGTERYPNPETLDALIEGLHAPLALHVCGRAAYALLDAEVEAPVLTLIRHDRIERIQINADLSEYAAAPERLDDAIRHLGKRVILQDNDANAPVLPLLKQRGVDVLFDRSGGRGRRPDHWPKPHSGTVCGYAGGLSPERMPEDLIDIDRAAGGREVWIDLESGLRDPSGAFCLTRAATVCAALAEHHASDAGRRAGEISADAVLAWLTRNEPDSKQIRDTVKRAVAAVVREDKP